MGDSFDIKDHWVPNEKEPNKGTRYIAITFKHSDGSIVSELRPYPFVPGDIAVPLEKNIDPVYGSWSDSGQVKKASVKLEAKIKENNNKCYRVIEHEK
jgi:hypothetical protein